MQLSDGPKAGQTVKTTLFPITLQGRRLGVRMSPPKLGEHTAGLLKEMGYGDADVEGLRSRNVVA